MKYPIFKLTLASLCFFSAQTALKATDHPGNSPTKKETVEVKVRTELSKYNDPFRIIVPMEETIDYLLKALRVEGQAPSCDGLNLTLYIGDTPWPSHDKISLVVDYNRRGYDVSSRCHASIKMMISKTRSNEPIFNTQDVPSNMRVYDLLMKTYREIKLKGGYSYDMMERIEGFGEFFLRDGDRVLDLNAEVSTLKDAQNLNFVQIYSNEDTMNRIFQKYGDDLTFPTKHYIILRQYMEQFPNHKEEKAHWLNESSHLRVRMKHIYDMHRADTQFPVASYNAVENALISR